jgi:hypothetical protein
VAAPPRQATRGTCRRWHRRQAACRHHHWRQVAGQGHAATPTGGRWQGRGMPPPPLAAGGRGRGHAATPTGGRGACRHPHWATSPGWTEGGRAGDANGGRGLPAMPMAAGATCRLPRGCRHPQPVLFDKTFRRGSFLAIHSRRWSDPSKIRGSSRCLSRICDWR